VDDIRNYVKERYAKAIKNSTSCCGSGGCCCSTTGSSDILSMTRGNYDGTVLEKAPGQMADQSFGCGNPFTEARIQPGETVLDLGSGAGLDLFLALEATGPSGKVIGLDMTEEMLETAAENLRGLDNVTLVKGYIEDMPLESSTVDVIISNCVINLSPDKGTVFLRPVTERAVKNLAAWSGCIAGALQETEYAALLKEAGFVEVDVRRTKVYEVPDALAAMAFPELSAEERKEINGALAGALIQAKKSSGCPPQENGAREQQ